MALKYVEDITVGNETVRGIKLASTDKAIVYIPVTALQSLDYQRLADIFEKPGSSSRLEKMRDNKLENGRAALTVYDSIIRYYYFNQERGSLSPTEQASAELAPKYDDEAEVEEEKPARKRGPGRPKKEDSE